MIIFNTSSAINGFEKQYQDLSDEKDKEASLATKLKTNLCQLNIPRKILLFEIMGVVYTIPTCFLGNVNGKFIKD